MVDSELNSLHSQQAGVSFVAFEEGGLQLTFKPERTATPSKSLLIHTLSNSISTPPKQHKSRSP